jgi:hypothetical protein
VKDFTLFNISFYFLKAHHIDTSWQSQQCYTLLKSTTSQGFRNIPINKPSCKSTCQNRDAPKAPTVVHGYSGLKFLPLEKANAFADCLENRFTQHVLYEENHERH